MREWLIVTKTRPPIKAWIRTRRADTRKHRDYQQRASYRRRRRRVGWFARYSHSISILLQRHKLSVFVEAVAATDGDVHQAGGPVEKTQAQNIVLREAQRR